jgi:hypothetical protein
MDLQRMGSRSRERIFCPGSGVTIPNAARICIAERIGRSAMIRKGNKNNSSA